jgi:hypothetical protein
MSRLFDLSPHGRGFLGAIIAALAVEFLAIALTTPPPVAFHGSGAYAPGGVYPATVPDPQLRFTIGTWVGGDDARGEVRSDALRAPPALALALAGGTSRPGEHVFVEREDTHETLSLAPEREPGEQWKHVIVALPPSWWGRHIVVVARDDGGGYRGWLGVGDLHVAGPADALATWGAGALPMVMLMLALLISVPAICCAVAFVAGDDAGGATTFGVTLLILGAVAEVLFFTYRGNATVGSWMTGTILLAGWGFSGYSLATPALRSRLATADVVLPWVISLGIGVGYALIVAQTTVPTANVVDTVTNAWWHFPPDNILPELLAQQVHAGLPAHPFLADWLSSDRPPLQSGFDLISMWLMPVPFPVSLRYEGLALWLQCLSFGGLYILARGFGFQRRRSAFAAVCCAATGFFFINAVYTWPKLITVAFGAASIAIAVAGPARERGLRFTAAGALFGLGMMAHSGVAFTLPALLVAAAIRYRSAAIKPLVAAGAAGIMVLAPWSVYQKVIDPPGDRLVKWHLGGQIAPDVSRSATRVIIDAYAAKSPAQIVAMKIDNFKQLYSGLVVSRPAEFFYTFSAVGVLWLPLLWLLLNRSHAPPERAARWLAVIGLASTALWCLIMWSGTVIHQGSYLSLALLMFPAALMAGRTLYAAIPIALVLLLDISTVWMVGVVPGPSLALDGVIIAIVATAMLFVARRPAPRWRGEVSASN